jgi:hypothetical protein
MEYANGLYINTDTINKILEIAYSKNYIEKNDYDLIINKCDKFKYNKIEKSFEFYNLISNICVKLEKKKFAECYTEVLIFQKFTKKN